MYEIKKRDDRSIWTSEEKTIYYLRGPSFVFISTFNEVKGLP